MCDFSRYIYEVHPRAKHHAYPLAKLELRLLAMSLQILMRMLKPLVTTPQLSLILQLLVVTLRLLLVLQLLVMKLLPMVMMSQKLQVMVL